MRLIDANALKVELDAWARSVHSPSYYLRENALYVIDKAPTVDAAPVVRCEKCAPTCDNCKNQGMYLLTPPKNAELPFVYKKTSLCDGCFDHSKFALLYNYCPNCGAKRDGECGA